MSFTEEIVWPQDSQTCCDNPLPFGKDIHRLNFLFVFRGGGGGLGLDSKKNSPGFVIGVKSVVVCRRLRRLPTVKGADVHRGRRCRRRFWRLRWFRAIMVVIGILCMVYHGRCCQDVKSIGRQVQVIQARWNFWEVPSKCIWHCGLIWVVINKKRYEVRGMRLEKLRAFLPYDAPIAPLILKNWGVIPLRAWLIGYLLHKEYIRIRRVNRNVRWHFEIEKKAE